MKYEMDGELYDSECDVAEEIVASMDDSWVEEQIYTEYGNEIEICGYYFDTIDALQSVSMRTYEALKESYLMQLETHLEKLFNRMTYGDVANVLFHKVKCLTREYDE